MKLSEILHQEEKSAKEILAEVGAVEVPHSIQPVDVNEIDLFTDIYNKTKGS